MKSPVFIFVLETDNKSLILDLLHCLCQVVKRISVFSYKTGLFVCNKGYFNFQRQLVKLVLTQLIKLNHFYTLFYLAISKLGDTIEWCHDHDALLLLTK